MKIKLSLEETMEFWKALISELKQAGFSAAQTKQLQEQFGSLDAVILLRLPPSRLAAGGSLSPAEAKRFSAIVRKVSDWLNAGGTPSEPTMPEVPSFTLRLIDVEAADKPPLRNVSVRVQRLDTDGKPERELFIGRVNLTGEVRFQTRPTTGGAPTKVQVRVIGLDDETLHTQSLTLDEKKPEIRIEVKVADHRNKTAGLLAEWGKALNKSLPTALSDLYKKETISSLADLRRKAEKLGVRKLPEEVKRAHTDLLAHANLQLISRDYKLNQALIDAGFRSFLAISSLSPSAFIKKVKGKIGEKEAAFLYKESERKTEVVKNFALEQRVNRANGFAQTSAVSDQPCSCDCQSAVSPLAYLADLLDFALREVTYDGNVSTLAGLEERFHQPFASLPGDCSASEELVRQARICIEVLRRKALAEGKDPTANTTVNQYAARAYDALLAGLGTSTRELRLLRGASASDRERKTQSLGILVSHLNDLLLQGNALSELSLEVLFGLQDTRRDPLSFGAKIGDASDHILQWQLKNVEWRRNTDDSGRIFGRMEKTGNKFIVTLYKDSARTAIVAKGEGRLQSGNKPSDLTLNHQNDSGLSARLLISRQATNTDFELAVVPQFLTWQLLELIQLWQAEDYPTPIYDPQLPIIDPDMLSKDHFCQPQATNEAYNLWVQREADLTAKLSEIDKTNSSRKRTFPQMINFVWRANPPDWDNIEKDLSSKDEDKVKASLTELAGFHLSAEAFTFLNELRKRRRGPAPTDPEIQRREAEERRLAIDILLNVIKRRDFYSDWHQDERVKNITLSPSFFCKPTKEVEPAHLLRVAAEQRTQWLSEARAQRPGADR